MLFIFLLFRQTLRHNHHFSSLSITSRFRSFYKLFIHLRLGCPSGLLFFMFDSTPSDHIICVCARHTYPVQFILLLFQYHHYNIIISRHIFLILVFHFFQYAPMFSFLFCPKMIRWTFIERCKILCFICVTMFHTHTSAMKHTTPQYTVYITIHYSISKIILWYGWCRRE